MQPSARQQELERLYNARRGHAPQISISDDSHHITEAIGSYYDHDEPLSPPANGNPRPYSFVSSPADQIDARASKTSRRNGSYFDMNRASPPRVPLGRKESNEQTPVERDGGSISPKGAKRMSSRGSENGSPNGNGSPGSPPRLSRQSSTDATMQSFPLNDIDYESSPAAVAQELSNLQAIRRMSMNVDASDPDLPSFGGVVPTVAPSNTEDDDDTSRLFWVPARLHPELAPKEFKTFIEDKVDRIRRRSGDSDTLSVDGLERQGSGSSLRRKKSMLSHQIDTKGDYQDGADRLERKRSKRMSVEGQAPVELSELEHMVSDPAQLIRRMSLDTVRRSQDSGVEVPASEDMPMLPPVGQSLKRSTRTTYRRGSLKKGERVPFSRRAAHRHSEPESDDSSTQPTTVAGADEPIMGLTRVQTEPTPPPERGARDTFPSRTEASLRWREQHQGAAQTTDDISTRSTPEERPSARPPAPPPEKTEQQPPRPQHKQFQSRLASGPGRTTAQLPGYTNTNPLPNIIETLPDGTKVPVAGLVQQTPERKSSHELIRPFQRGGAHMRPVPGREHHRSSTLDDISGHPSPLPGSGTTRTDDLTMVPTFEDRKAEKKDGSRKSSWKWILGNDEEKERAKEEKQASDTASIKSSKSSKLSKPSGDKARLDVLQNSIEGNVPPRGRESIVLNREDLRLDEERKKESKKISESKKDRDKESRDSGLLSAIFGGGKKKTSDGDLKQKHRKSDRNSSPDPIIRILKPDIDYNWTRFSILEERAIYRMAHIKLANPRRALYSQVLLSNFMYSYLAKVQMMHPQVQIPPAHQQKQRRQQQQQQEEQQQQQNQPVEYSQYQRWQQQQEREAAANSNNNPQHQQQQQQHAPNQKRTSLDIATGAGAPQHHSQHQQYQQHQQHQQRTSYDPDSDSSAGYDPRSSEEYEYDQHQHQQQQQQQHHPSYQPHQPPSRNGVGTARGSGGGGGGYSVAGTHDYLGYPKEQQGFGGGERGLWDDDDEGRGGREELW
ncbi:uncharacterized protein LTR77_011106 [Saxophila tyrrhenica]|uniref:Protein Zds1 C-terminal domain-containing protein n=1 Tax=Saxophila tyrrhenica TaxID=1690608 RepID=A0AAV9NTT5_9PEZI|nr:hypothetical protein LTR77_011106 [Saxophila tyrrhenica]